MLWYIVGFFILFLFLKFQLNNIKPSKRKSYKKWLENIKKST